MHERIRYNCIANLCPFIISFKNRKKTDTKPELMRAKMNRNVDIHVGIAFIHTITSMLHLIALNIISFQPSAHYF